MGEDAEAKYIDEKEGRDEVPDEVSRCKGLNHAASTGISPYALLPVHRLALLIGEHAPQRQDVDESALEQRDDMCIPARPLSPVGGVLLGSVLHRKPWRYDEVDEEVHQGSEDNLVYMLRQHGEIESFSEGPHPFAEGRNGRYKEGVLHGCVCRRGFRARYLGCEDRRGLAAAVGEEKRRSLRAHTRPDGSYKSPEAKCHIRGLRKPRKQVASPGRHTTKSPRSATMCVQRLRIRWDLHATVEVRVTAA